MPKAFLVEMYFIEAIGSLRFSKIRRDKLYLFDNNIICMQKKKSSDGSTSSAKCEKNFVLTDCVCSGNVVLNQPFAIKA